jgi:hypothetical protein
MLWPERAVCFFFAAVVLAKQMGTISVKSISSKLGYLCRCVIINKGLELLNAELREN